MIYTAGKWTAAQLNVMAVTGVVNMLPGSLTQCLNQLNPIEGGVAMVAPPVLGCEGEKEAGIICIVIKYITIKISFTPLY